MASFHGYDKCTIRIPSIRFPGLSVAGVDYQITGIAPPPLKIPAF